MKRVKRFTSVLLICCMVLMSLAGCTNSAGNTKPEGDIPASAEAMDDANLSED